MSEYFNLTEREKQNITHKEWEEEIEELENCLRHLARGPMYHPASCKICTRVKEILKGE